MREPLSIISDTYFKFQEVVPTVCGRSKTFCGFEFRLEAAVSNYHTVCNNAKLTSFLLAFVLLSKAQFDGSERVSIFFSVSCS